MSFNPALYPRTYRSSLFWRVFMVGTGAAMAAGGLIGAWFLAAGDERHDATQFALLAGMCVLFILLGAACAYAALRAKLVLLPDAVELVGLTKVQRLARGEIAAYRIKNAGHVDVMELKPVRPDLKNITVTMMFKPDAEFNAWFAGIADLNALELAASQKEAEADAALGATVEERLEKVGRARKVARALTVGAFGALAWVWFYPEPYAWAIGVAAALPWLAIALCLIDNRAYTIEDPGKNTVRADLTALLIMPGIILLLRAMYDANVIDWSEVLLPALAGAVVMSVVIALAGPGLRAQKKKLLLMCALAAVYPIALVPLVNVMFDHAGAQGYKVTILAKRQTTGRSATNYLKVSAWGPYGEANELEVDGGSYGAVRPGQVICVRRHPGALHIGWYSLTSARYC